MSPQKQHSLLTALHISPTPTTLSDCALVQQPLCRLQPAAATPCSTDSCDCMRVRPEPVLLCKHSKVKLQFLIINNLVCSLFHRVLLALAEFAGLLLQKLWKTGSPAAAFNATSHSYIPDFTRCIDHFALHAGEQRACASRFCLWYWWL